jgi:hypothetical protein
MPKEMKNTVLILTLIALALAGCKEDPVGQQPLDSVRPGEVTQVTVKNIPGGAVLYYVPPRDEDLLYVKAIYKLNDGLESETRASLYTDSLVIQGFGDTADRDVDVIAVDRSRNESAPVKVGIAPLEAPVVTIGATLDLLPDFGGVHAYWDNPTRSEISIVLLREDHNKEYVPLETFYSSARVGDGAKREMDTITANFAVYVQDRWQNRSEKKYYTLTPIFETRLDRNKFKVVELTGDAGAAGGWPKTNMWNDQFGDNGYSSPANSGIWPHSFTMDLGVLAKMSRVRIFQRLGPYIYAEGNPRKFEVWGCETLDPSGSWDNWTKLMDCTSIKPSGQPINQNSAEDIDRATNGEDFISPPTNPKVRYLRFRVSQTWAGGDNFQISELQIFGDAR